MVWWCREVKKKGRQWKDGEVKKRFKTAILRKITAILSWKHRETPCKTCRYIVERLSHDTTSNVFSNMQDYKFRRKCVISPPQSIRTKTLVSKGKSERLRHLWQNSLLSDTIYIYLKTADIIYLSERHFFNFSLCEIDEMLVSRTGILQSWMKVHV